MTLSLRRIKIILLITAGILLIPLIGNFTTESVNFQLGDFIAAAILIFSLGMSIDLANQKLRNSKYRYWIVGLIILLFLLLWAELAVGIFGTPFAGS